jgi:hypothetical protein
LISLNLCFHLQAIPETSIPQIINPLLSLIRETYLEVCGIVPVEQVGTWLIKVEGVITWITGVNIPSGNILQTAVQRRGERPSTLLTDPWIPAEQQ